MLNDNRSVPQGRVGLSVQLEHAWPAATAAPVFGGRHELVSEHGHGSDAILAEDRDVSNLIPSEQLLALLERFRERVTEDLAVLAFMRDGDDGPLWCGRHERARSSFEVRLVVLV